MKKQWFETWFDSKYYHLLYKKRDKQEASLFISALLDLLKPSESAKFLDLACGKGRHSIYLNSLGFRVDGLDYSKNNIKKAKNYQNKTLNFYVHDMREHIPYDKYDYVFNLFTSFGYFKNDLEHQNSINNVYECLNKDGHFVLDYLNIKKVEQNLKDQEIVTQSGIDFYITRKIEDGFVKKNIAFQLDNKEYNFEENVRAFDLNDLTKILNHANFNIVHKLGNYKMQAYTSESDRLILIAQK